MRSDFPRCTAHQDRTDAGVIAPSRMILLAIVAIAIAAVGFLVTKPTQPGVAAQTVASSARPAAKQTAKPSPTPTAKPSPSADPVLQKSPEPLHKKHKKHKVVQQETVSRSGTTVEVYNNSGITGLAAATASRAESVGWNVVSSDNWYGTIPASTVYYPAGMETEAQTLANDLGIARMMPAVSPMRLDRLTVILTTDYS